MSRPLVAFLAAVAAIALSGCRTIDADKLEGEISDGISGDLQKFDVTAESVDCPNDVESETGATFECTVTTDEGQELTIDVKVTDGGNGDVEYRFDQKSLRELAFGGQAAKSGS